MSSVVIAEFPTAKVQVEWNKGAPYSIIVDGEVVIRRLTRKAAINEGVSRALNIMAARE